MEELVNKLINNNKTISTMESATGGAVVSAITNVDGSSRVLKFSAITYSNEYKIKMGVKKETIDKYSVYSTQVAKEMSFNISKFSNSNYGVGITGKLNRVDENNLFGDDSTVFISIYDRDNDKYYNEIVKAIKTNRIDNKRLVIDKIEELMLKII